MSRNYDVEIFVQGISAEDVIKALPDYELEHVNTNNDEDLGVIEMLFGPCVLCGGCSEEEAHEAISTALKAINPDVKVATAWAYLDDPPREYCGDAEIIN